MRNLPECRSVGWSHALLIVVAAAVIALLCLVLLMTIAFFVATNCQWAMASPRCQPPAAAAVPAAATSADQRGVVKHPDG